MHPSRNTFTNHYLELRHHLIFGLILLLCVLPYSTSILAAAEQGFSVKDEQATVKALRSQIIDGSLAEEKTSDAHKQLLEFIRISRECVNTYQDRFDNSTGQLETLGDPLENENKSLKTARQNLEETIEKYQKKITNCKLLMIESNMLIEELKKQDAAALTAELSTRYPGILSLLVKQPNPYVWLASLRETEIHHLGTEHLDATRLPVFIVLTILLLLASIYIKKYRLARLEVPLPEAGLSTEILVAFRASFLRYLPGLMLFSGWTAFWLIIVGEDRPWPQLAVLSFSLCGFVIALIISRSFFSPPRPARHYLPIDRRLSQRFWIALYNLIIVIAISVAIFNSPFYQGLSEPVLVLTRLLDAIIFAACLIWVIWLAFTLNSIRGIGLFRPLVTLALIAGVFAEILGYRDLSSYILGGIFLSMLSLAITWVIGKLFNEFLDGLDQGHYRWVQRLRDRIGLTETQAMPGLIWLRLISAIFVWGGLAFVLLRIWGLSSQGETLLLRYLNEGFTVGPLTIVPRQIAIALILFTLLLAVVAWIKQQLDLNWLSKTRIERGAREATVTISGYVGVALALIIALSVAGVDFKNLAIIAGALSVGIGFGLQNIVNNFVSGLILLFERPISTGDWIVVGNTQGYVKSINIRSTQIMTFDRADVIVPNSELISGQVTNWMLRDLSGRVCVPIGVAYGTDSTLVKQVLLEVADGHPAPIKNGSLSAPYVLFMGFGDSSLNFELRFFIANVDQRINVISDINYAIDAAFRKAGIEIPFPQRDLHIRDWPGDSATIVK